MNIITIAGIRPDFIRMSEVFRRLDEDPTINHILIHTGQHYDDILSRVFFDELEIRKPNYNLRIGGNRREHFHQSADLTVKLIELIRKNHLDPDLIMFLGDSNSVMVAPSLKKEGFRVAHIEAGMRSGDRRMLEEINRTVCDHSSDILFTYHQDYSENLYRENITKNVHNVGNTIVEVAANFVKEITAHEKKNDLILLDIHRPENFKDRHRLQEIFHIARDLSLEYSLPCVSLEFPRTYSFIKQYGIDTFDVEQVRLMPYTKYLKTVYNAKCVISDSGTAQEEPALLKTPVLVPRDFTERPQSYSNNCSKKMNLHGDRKHFLELLSFIERDCMCRGWLGRGDTSHRILEIIKRHGRTL